MGRRRGFEEADVLAAATESFWDAGYAGTSLDDVLAATGLGKGSLYGAFGDKRALFLRVFDTYCDRASDAVRRKLAGPDRTAARRIRALLKGSARTGADGAPRACLLAKTTAELGSREPEVAARAQRTFTELASTLESAVIQAQKAGDIPAGVDSAKAAHLLLAVLRGNEALSQAGVKPVVMRDAADAALNAITMFPNIS